MMATEKESANSSRLTAEHIAFPKGGGAIKGLNENFHVDPFTGEGMLGIPLLVSPCRGVEPKLTLQYGTSGGNGLFGVGFSLGLPCVSRRTSKNIPRYDDTDVFTLTGVGDLILRRTYQEKDETKVSEFIPRHEEAFTRIERLEKDGSCWWRTVDGKNTVSTFGQSQSFCVTNPECLEDIFAWLLVETADEKGNRIQYEYDSDYRVTSIRYGNLSKRNGEERWGFTVKFLYTSGRADTFIRHDSGFARKVDALCTEIHMVHCLGNGVETVRKTLLSYQMQGGVSLLKKISVVGLRKNAKRSMPDICFSYTPFSPEQSTWQSLAIDSGHPLVMRQGEFVPVDLYGDGIDGLLYADGNTALYCRAMGNYRYGSPETLSQFPIHRTLLDKAVTLDSLEGNGQYELVVRSSALNGYYPLEKGAWSNFRPFMQITNEQCSNTAETANLQGDRLRHLMVTEGGRLRYYPSVKKTGVSAPVERELPAGFPAATQNSKDERVLFLDMFGDGLDHRVQVRNGNVECFPNLGYGRFGKKIKWENAPYFPDGIDVSRLFFSDIDGSGTVDFIYLYPDRADIYWNRGGRFEGPFSVTLPEQYTNMDRLSFADVNGTGTHCMIFSKMGAGCEVLNYCKDFCGAKPYMLCTIDTNTGMRTGLEYESSAVQSLRDRIAGNPWTLCPPFPIQLVACRRDIDAINGVQLITNYYYRDGLYDSIENEFSGFGQIERHEMQYVPEAARTMSKTVIKSWYYTGHDLSDRYFNGDAKAPTLKDVALDVSDVADAQKVLWGRPLREEQYGESAVPIGIHQWSYQIRELIKPERARGAYFAYESEKLHSVYEGELDPRTTHSFALHVDNYGNVRRSCEICYARRFDALGADSTPTKLLLAQKTPHIVLTLHTFINEDMPRHLGVLVETQSYDINLPCHEYYTCESLCAELDTSMQAVIPYGAVFSAGVKQSRLQQWERTYYWDREMKQALPLGEVGALVLTHHKERAAFPEGYMLGDWFSNEQVEEAGYLLQDNYWWSAGKVTGYWGGECFYLTRYQEYTGGFGRNEQYYDAYLLLPVKETVTVGEGTANETTAELDYTALQYREITDWNGNVSQTLYDPLGSATATSFYGTVLGQREGDADIREYQEQGEASVDEIINFPEKYLQGMGTYRYTDLLQYQRERKPVRSVELTRGESVIMRRVTYLDGSGQVLEERDFAGHGKWAVRNTVIRDLFGNTLLNYPDRYEQDYKFLDVPDIPPSKYIYDSAHRPVRLETPGIIPTVGYGYRLSDAEYHAWEEVQCDSNSMVEECEYSQLLVKHYPECPTDEQVDSMAALKKSLQFSKQQRRTFFDNRFNKIGEMRDHRSGEHSVYTFDSSGNVTSAADARLHKDNSVNLTSYFDMLGHLVLTESCDAGRTCQLFGTFGNRKIIHEGDTVHRQLRYDGLQRLVENLVEGVGCVERFAYGEYTTEAKAKNLCGHIYQVCDQAGTETTACRNIQGLVLMRERRLCRQYEGPVDWSGTPQMEETTLCEKFDYDCRGKVTSHRAADETQYRYSYNPLGYLQSISLLQAEVLLPVVREIGYDAQGKRTFIQYGNGVVTKQRFSPTTTLLQEVCSAKDTGEILQHLSYSYDLAGNLSRIRDNTTTTTFGFQQVVTPFRDFTYDALYRLKTATGRELAGHANDFGSLVPCLTAFSYDAGSNLTKIRHRGTSGDSTLEMEYASGSNRLSKAGSDLLDYDCRGNMKSMQGVRSLGWNSQNRLVRAVQIERTDGGNDEEFYGYDAQGMRIRKVTIRKCTGMISQTAEKIKMGNSDIVRASAAGKYLSCTRLAEDEIPFAAVYCLPAANKNAPPVQEIIYYLGDYLGSVNIELNSKAEVIRCEEYHPFGGTSLLWTSKSDAPQKEYRFCSKELDGTTGLYQFGARYYCPHYGRMISSDATTFINFEDARTLNLYAYCLNDPLGHRDPTGNQPVVPNGLDTGGTQQPVTMLAAQTAAQTEAQTAAQTAAPSVARKVVSLAWGKVNIEEKVQIVPPPAKPQVTQATIQTRVDKVIISKIPRILALDSSAVVGYRGSLATGTKFESGEPFDPKDYDVDAFIVSNALESRVKGYWKSGRQIAKILPICDELENSFRGIPGYRVDKQNPFTFRLYSNASYRRIVRPDNNVVKILN